MTDAQVATPLAHRRVLDELRRMVIEWPFSSGALPSEQDLMRRYEVSRGTLRRATNELVRAGLLSAERGRGTYVVRDEQVRVIMEDVMLEFGHPDSRWHLDYSRFVPDFDGSDRAAERVAESSPYQASSSVFVTPDNSLGAFTVRALNDGKKVLVPTFGLRRGIMRLDPSVISPSEREFASTLDGLERLGHRLTLSELSRERIDLCVSGAIAIGDDGRLFNQREGFLDIELALLLHLEVIEEDVPLLAVVHDAQLLGLKSPGPTHVDAALTPSRSVSFQRARSGASIDVLLAAQEANPTLAYLGELLHPEKVST
jgi:5-formyltetrahydrofolate cyclo-ligase